MQGCGLAITNDHGSNGRGERDLNIFLAGSICGRPSVARGMADLRRAIDPESIASGISLADSPPVIGGPSLYGDLIGEEE